MTAIHAILQPSIQTAWIISDGAYTDEWGRLVRIGPKVICGNGGEPWAMAVTGSVDPLFVQQAVGDYVALGFSQVGRFLPDIARRAIDKQRVDWVRPDDDPELMLTLAGWDPRSRKMVILVVASGDFTHDHNEPFEVYQTDFCLTLGDSADAIELFGRKVDFSDPYDFDPVKEAVPLIAKQRQLAYPAPSGFTAGWSRQRRIGGSVWLTKITAAGVEQSVLHRFPDLVGQRIRPDREGVRNFCASLARSVRPKA